MLTDMGRWAWLGVLAAIGGCGRIGFESLPWYAGDAGVDAGRAIADAGIDAGRDAGKDAATVADAGVDAGRDAGSDAAVDAGSDAAVGPAVDAGSDAAVDAGGDAATVNRDVHVVMTADNAFSFAYGTSTEIGTFVRGMRSSLAGGIFSCPVGNGPEAYTVPEAAAPPGSYLYIVTWDDLMVTQGVLGQFEREGNVVYTGDMRFEVCATGLDYSVSTMSVDAINGPTEAVVEAEIVRCNDGVGAAATTSQGWVNAAGAVTANAKGTLAIGEANDLGSGGIFPNVCTSDVNGIGVNTAARWMWYTPQGFAGSPFNSTGTNTFRAFLIFRLQTDEIGL